MNLLKRQGPLSPPSPLDTMTGPGMIRLCLGKLLILLAHRYPYLKKNIGQDTSNNLFFTPPHYIGFGLLL